MRSLVRHQGSFPLQRSDVNYAVVQSLTLLQSKLETRNVSIHEELQDNLPPVLALPIQLEQIVINIVMNAAHALENKEGQRNIMITTRETDDGYVQLSIRDNGPGLKGLGEKYSILSLLQKNPEKIWDWVLLWYTPLLPAGKEPLLLSPHYLTTMGH